MDWNAISAVATVAATLAALGIATRNEYKSQQVAVKMAGLHAATYLAQLTDIVEIAGQTSTGFLINEDRISHAREFPTQLPGRWESAISVLNAEALTRLEPLPNNAAYRAAVAIGSLSAISHNLREFENAKVGWHDMERNVRIGHIRRMRVVFYDAHITLRAALLDFERAARSQIKPLTFEEQGFTDSE